MEREEKEALLGASYVPAYCPKHLIMREPLEFTLQSNYF